MSVDYNSLRELHRCHLRSVPFEVIDIHLKKEISLELSNIYSKVVLRNRGGFCYELNYLFYSLLQDIGFNCTMVSARIFKDEEYGPDFDHMSVVVSLEEEWLVDVGFSDLFIEPLKIQSDKIQEDYLKNYKIERLNDNEFLLLESLKNPQDFKWKYIFEKRSRSISEFHDMCFYKQYSPDSYFVKNKVCAIATKNGRKTILNDTFKIRSYDQVEEREIKDNSDLLKVLKDEFNISIAET